MNANLVLLGGARRTTLAEQLVQVWSSAGVLELHSFERSDEFFPISSIAKVVAAPMFRDPKFDDMLAEYLAGHRALVLGCMDAAIPAIARLRGRDFGGGVIVGPTAEGAAISLNKGLTHEFCRKAGIAHPRRYPHETDASRHLIAKPVEGFGGKGISFIEPGQAQHADQLVATHIVQERLAGQETTHDVYVDRHGGFISCSRDRLAVIDGEVDHCIVRETAADEAALFAALAASGLFWGPVTVQTFRTPAGEVVLIEINARLGGGVTASIAAGFPILEAFFEESLGVALPRRQFRPLEMKRARRDFYRFLPPNA